MPLPPYIQRTSSEDDKERYQTVFARQPGAVAAPTAGLHFEQRLIAALTGQGVLWDNITLHVGAGTFLPVQCERIEAHEMHAERITVAQRVCARIRRVKKNGGRVVAVGTTVVRALESAAVDGDVQPYSGDTRLFITPGFRFNVVNALITNFHLPKSSLMVLVSAFAGHEEIMRLYRYGVEHRLRFFSYGDAMFLERQ